jgi:single-strand selective monofunctional uracil DNA glycosylase
MNTSETAVLVRDSAARLAGEADRLRFEAKASFIYNPLIYAWKPHAAYIEKFCSSPVRVLFVGMNPGPWGMAQTGVPFGEINMVKDWLHITGEVVPPAKEHPGKPILGFDCSRSEVSGRRLWGLMKERFDRAEVFFQDHFVTNYCPLIFLEEGGKNLTPDKLPVSERKELFRICDSHLRDLIDLLKPEFVIGVGKFAEKRAAEVVSRAGSNARVASILHPSPASPMANRGWAEQATTQLTKLEIWD